MSNNKWIETRKKFEIDEAGNENLTKTVRELDRFNSFSRKEIVDISRPTVAAFSIAIPFFLFIVQQNAETKKQRELFRLDVYTNTSVAYHSILKSVPMQA